MAARIWGEAIILFRALGEMRRCIGDASPGSLRAGRIVIGVCFFGIALMLDPLSTVRTISSALELGPNAIRIETTQARAGTMTAEQRRAEYKRRQRAAKAARERAKREQARRAKAKQARAKRDRARRQQAKRQQQKRRAQQQKKRAAAKRAQQRKRAQAKKAQVKKRAQAKKRTQTKKAQTRKRAQTKKAQAKKRVEARKAAKAKKAARVDKDRSRTKRAHAKKKADAAKNRQTGKTVVPTGGANDGSEIETVKESEEQSNEIDVATEDEQASESEPGNKTAKDQDDERDEERDEIVVEANPVPSTLVELIGTLISPKAPKAAEETDRAAEPETRVVLPDRDNPPAAQPIATKSAEESSIPTPIPTTKKKRRSSSGWSIGFGGTKSFKQHEVLALNANAATLTKARRLGFRLASKSNFPNLSVAVAQLKTPEGMSAKQARRLLATEMPRNGFSLNHTYRVANHDTCDGNRCFGTAAIEWRDELARCSHGLKIGVIDTGLDLAHRTFTGRRIHVGEFIQAGRPKGTTDHGTGVVALLAGHPDSHTPGLLPEAEIYVADVFHEDSSREPVADTVSLLKALDWMSAWQVKIINMSITGPKDELVEKAIHKLTAKGTIIVAAAGNNGPHAPPRFPAAYDPVVSVTAVDKRLRVYRHANRGNYIDVAAPGVGVWTAAPNDRATFKTGTSFAAPYVTAILALAQADARKQRSGAQLVKKLPRRDLGPEGPDKIYGEGLLLAPDKCRPPVAPKQLDPSPFATVVSSHSEPSPTFSDANTSTIFGFGSALEQAGSVFSFGRD